MTVSAPAHPQFPHLFRPFTIRDLTLRNRIAISGHHAGWNVTVGGMPSDELAAYIEERAKGGVALFVIGSTCPVAGYDWIENVSDAVIPHFQNMADAGHRHGTAVFAQLCHRGYFPLPGPPRVSPVPRAASIGPSSRGGVRYQPSRDELQSLVAAHGQAARRALEGGLDGVELHAHEFFLAAQMISPVWNTRADDYGGSFENRMRWLRETLRAMRRDSDPNFVVGVRLKADDMLPGGMHREDYAQVLRILEAENLVDYVNLTGGDAHHHHGPMPRPEGEWLDLIAYQRAQTNLPLMHAGRLSTPELAERALRENIVDIAVMTKNHIADAHFARKVFENRQADIRFCTRCLQACHGQLERMSCVYNPVTSREREWAQLVPAQTKKRVVIVGAGPAGMEAALTLAGRGHEPIVLERASRVGGQVWAGASSPLRTNWARIGEFYQRQAAKNEWEVRLNCDATPAQILSLQPDAVIVATGSRPDQFCIEGGAPALNATEVVAGQPEGARRVLIFDTEGFSRALVAADALSARGIQVEFLTSHQSVFPIMDQHMRDEMVSQLLARGVKFHPAYAPIYWTSERQILARDMQTGAEQLFNEIDALVATVGSTSENQLARELRPLLLEQNIALHVIGDANRPQTLQHATYQGARLGREL